MTLEELRINVVEVEQRAKSNTHRINQLEYATAALNDLTASMKVLVTKQDYIAEKVDGLDCKVNAIEQKPAKKWETAVDRVLNLILGAVIAYLLVKIGIAQ